MFLVPSLLSRVGIKISWFGKCGHFDNFFFNFDPDIDVSEHNFSHKSEAPLHCDQAAEKR